MRAKKSEQSKCAIGSSVPNCLFWGKGVNDFGYDLLYDMAQQYGHAQLVWYALNGKRVVEGEYTDKD